MSFEKVEKFGSSESRTFATRVVIRSVEEKNMFYCGSCDKPIVYSKSKKPKQVIANLYEEGVWQETVTYHLDCYEAVGEPHGQPYTDTPPMTQEEHRERLTRIIHTLNEQSA